MSNGELDAIVKAAAGKGADGARRLVDRVMKEHPARTGEALTAIGGLQGAVVWEEALGAARACVRELGKRAEEKGLDTAINEVEATLVGLWAIEHAGGFRVPDMTPPPVNAIAETFPPAMRKLAPPPPKKQKLDAPRRNVLPLSTEGVRKGLDVAMMLQGLYEIGDWTSLPDKARSARELFFDDWRRMLFESGGSGWEPFRQMAAAPAPESAVEKGLVTRFSRQTMADILRAIAERRRDNISTVPAVSVLKCAQCGGNHGRERMRCESCAGMFCVKCRARTADLCLADYSASRYGSLAAETRLKISGEAKELCAKLRVDEHTRNDRFVKALAEKGVDVVFQDMAPTEGQEADGDHGRRKLVVLNRENTTTKKAFFSSLARVHFKAAEMELTPQLESLFIDACLGVPIEIGLQWHGERKK